MVYSLLVFVNMRVILCKTYVVLICGKYNTLTLQLKINIAIRVLLHNESGHCNNRIGKTFNVDQKIVGNSLQPIGIIITGNLFIKASC